MLTRTISVALCLFGVIALHPRPKTGDKAAYARWLVHESDYAVVSEHQEGDIGVFGNIVSISDGLGYENSTGVIYTYLPNLDTTYQDVMKDPRVALTFSEKALNGSKSCSEITAENPPCGRLVISGRLTKVPEEHKEEAEKILFSRHSDMKAWSGAHMFVPFWIAPENMTSIYVINFYGGASHPTAKEYFASPWQAAKAAGHADMPLFA